MYGAAVVPAAQNRIVAPLLYLFVDHLYDVVAAAVAANTAVQYGLRPAAAGVAAFAVEHVVHVYVECSNPDSTALRLPIAVTDTPQNGIKVCARGA